MANSTWTALIGFLTMPWFLHFLGMSAFGMVGIHLTLQAMFALVDLGFAPAISREVARASNDESFASARPVVHSMAVVFVAAGAVASLGLAVLAPWIAETWIADTALPSSEVTASLVLSALAIGTRWPGTFYVGVLTGARRIDLASGVSIASVTLANVGVLAILAYVENSLRAFFLWQIAIGALHSLAMRQLAWRAIGRGDGTKFSREAVASVWRFTAGMGFVAATGAVLVNTDRLVLARTSTLAEVGQYTIAAALAGLLYRITIPAFNLVYPRLSELHAHGDSAQMGKYFRESTRRFLSLIFPAAMFLYIAAGAVLLIWLGDTGKSPQLETVVRLLCLGTAIHCIMYFPFALQIASGNTRLPLFTNVLLVLFFIPVLVVLSSSLGATGAAIAWIFVHCLYFVAGTAVTSRFVEGGRARPWLTRAVLPPLAFSLAFGWPAAVAVDHADSSFIKLLIAGSAATMALLLGLGTLPEAAPILRRAASRMAPTRK